MKITDLYKNAGTKINEQVKKAGAPGRFGAGAATAPDRREQRKRDQAAGLVPFAVKLNAGLVKEIHALAQDRKVGVNDLVAQLLKKGLED